MWRLQEHKKKIFGLPGTALFLREGDLGYLYRIEGERTGYTRKQPSVKADRRKIDRLIYSEVQRGKSPVPFRLKR